MVNTSNPLESAARALNEFNRLYTQALDSENVEFRKDNPWYYPDDLDRSAMHDRATLRALIEFIQKEGDASIPHPWAVTVDDAFTDDILQADTQNLWSFSRQSEARFYAQQIQESYPEGFIHVWNVIEGRLVIFYRGAGICLFT